MSKLEQLLKFKHSLSDSFNAIKDSPMDFNKLMTHVGNLSFILDEIMADEIESKDLIFKAHMDVLSSDEIPMRDGSIRPMVWDTRPWKALGRTIRKGNEVDLSQVPYYKIKCWSDQHFFQEKIIEYTKRPYVDAADMNAQMVANYNASVDEGDIVIWVGDVSFAGVEKTNELLRQCKKGYNIHVVGNHDLDRHTGKLKMMEFDEIHTSLFFDDLVFTHHPWKVNLPQHLWNVHGHIHNGVLPDKHHTNVSVEVVNFRPKRLDILLTETGYYDNE